MNILTLSNLIGITTQCENKKGIILWSIILGLALCSKLSFFYLFASITSQILEVLVYWWRHRFRETKLFAQVKIILK